MKTEEHWKKILQFCVITFWLVSVLGFWTVRWNCAIQLILSMKIFDFASWMDWEWFIFCILNRKWTWAFFLVLYKWKVMVFTCSVCICAGDQSLFFSGSLAMGLCCLQCWGGERSGMRTTVWHLREDGFQHRCNNPVNKRKCGLNHWALELLNCWGGKRVCVRFSKRRYVVINNLLI